MQYKRIRKLREDYEKTQEEMAQLLKINRVVYNRYERGIRDLPIDILIEITDIFNVSIDYILERTNIKNYDLFLNDIKELENKLLCPKCQLKSMKHIQKQQYKFKCSKCGHYIQIESNNFCKN